MVYYVYLIKTVKGFLNKSYVGYSNNFNKRLDSHNKNKGAKSTLEGLKQINLVRVLQKHYPTLTALNIAQ